MSAESRRVEPVPDSRIKPEQCGAVRVLAGNEFVCINPPHNDPTPESAAMRVWRGKRPLADFHMFIRRYPDA